MKKITILFPKMQQQSFRDHLYQHVKAQIFLLDFNINTFVSRLCCLYDHFLVNLVSIWSHLTSSSTGLIVCKGNTV